MTVFTHPFFDVGWKVVAYYRLLTKGHLRPHPEKVTNWGLFRTLTESPIKYDKWGTYLGQRFFGSASTMALKLALSNSIKDHEEILLWDSSTGAVNYYFLKQLQEDWGIRKENRAEKICKMCCEQLCTYLLENPTFSKFSVNFHARSYVDKTQLYLEYIPCKRATGAWAQEGRFLH